MRFHRCRSKSTMHVFMGLNLINPLNTGTYDTLKCHNSPTITNHNAVPSIASDCLLPVTSTFFSSIDIKWWNSHEYTYKYGNRVKNRVLTDPDLLIEWSFGASDLLEIGRHFVSYRAPICVSSGSTCTSQILFRIYIDFNFINHWLNRVPVPKIPGNVQPHFVT